MRILMVLLFSGISTFATAQTYCRDGSVVFYDGEKMNTPKGECAIRRIPDAPFMGAEFNCPDGLYGGIVADKTDMVISSPMIRNAVHALEYRTCD